MAEDLEIPVSSSPYFCSYTERLLNHSQQPIPSWIGEMENFLMNDENNGTPDEPDTQFLDHFLADVLLDSPSSLPSDKIEVSDGSKCGEKTEKERIDVPQGKINYDSNDDGDDPVSRKRRRQLRNRDAALRSRERRKMYIKDLEMKSGYLEGECRRLSWLLQCCATENHALRLQLQSGQAFGASMTKQESAVLLLESLLLGSLFWLLGIICLPPAVSPSWSVLEVALQESAEGVEILKRRERGNINRLLSLETLCLGRRCGVARSKMKCKILYAGILV